jgi:hypothetical protein
LHYNHIKDENSFSQKLERILVQQIDMPMEREANEKSFEEK